MKKWYKITYPDGRKQLIGELKGATLHMTRHAKTHMWEEPDGRKGWSFSNQILEDPSIRSIMLLDADSSTHYFLEQTTWDAMITVGTFLRQLTHDVYGDQIVFPIEAFTVTQHKDFDASIPMKQITPDQAIFLLQHRLPVFRQRRQPITFKDIQNETVSAFIAHDYYVEEGP